MKHIGYVLPDGGGVLHNTKWLKRNVDETRPAMITEADWIAFQARSITSDGDRLGSILEQLDAALSKFGLELHEHHLGSSDCHLTIGKREKENEA